MLVDLNEVILTVPVEWYRVWDPQGKPWTSISLRVILDDYTRAYIDIPINADQVDSKQVTFIKNHLDSGDGKNPYLAINGMVVNKNSKDGKAEPRLRTGLSKIGIPVNPSETVINRCVVSGKVEGISPKGPFIVAASYRDPKKNIYKDRLIPVICTQQPSGLLVGKRVLVFGKVRSELPNKTEKIHISAPLEDIVPLL
jgi:hypothetical protein